MNERPPDGYTWSGERLARKQTTSRPDNAWPDMWQHMSDAAKSKAKQKWAIEKLKLDDAGQLRARRKLEIPMPAAMPCTTPANCRGDTYRSIGKNKTKYSCIVDADETMRIRLEGAPHRYHEDHISVKGINSLNHYNLVHKIIPMPQAMKIPNAKAAVVKEWENWRKFRHGS